MTPRLARCCALATLAAFAVVAAACSGGNDAGADTSTSAAPTTATTAATTTTGGGTTTTTAPRPAAPLTGLGVDDDAVLARPALVVKIDNHPEARPQSGLTQADIVYEELVEGISRFAAVYHTSAPQPVGPIRSARTSDPDIIAALGRPLFAWSGGNPGVTRAIARANVVDVGFATRSAEGGYFRERARRAPHNLYADAVALFGLAEPDQSPPPPQFAYRKPGDPLPEGAEEVAGVKVVFTGTQVLYQWDPDLRGWARSEYGGPHRDADGTRIAPENVVVMFTQYRRSPADPISPEAVTTGEGFVWVFTDGRLVTGVWKRTSANKPAELVDANLRPIELTPGRTWVALAQANKAAVIPAGADPASVPWPRP